MAQVRNITAGNRFTAANKPVLKLSLPLLVLGNAFSHTKCLVADDLYKGVSKLACNAHVYTRQDIEHASRRNRLKRSMTCSQTVDKVSSR